MVSEPTCRVLCAGCLSGVGTYLLGIVMQVAGCFSGVGTYLPGTLLQGCRLFKQCWYLPARHCPVPQITKKLGLFTIKYEENFERSIGTFSTTHIFAND